MMISSGCEVERGKTKTVAHTDAKVSTWGLCLPAHWCTPGLYTSPTPLPSIATVKQIGLARSAIPCAVICDRRHYLYPGDEWNKPSDRIMRKTGSSWW